MIARWMMGLCLLGCRSDKINTNDDGITEATLSDSDSDGYLADEDCDDADPNIYPGATELCDGLDNNCDGEIDEGVLSIFYADADGDGFGSDSVSIEACEVPNGYVPISSDCDDDNPAVFPGVTDNCDGIDNDCDGVIDNGGEGRWYQDLDGDGYGDDATLLEGCQPSEEYIDRGGDCNHKRRHHTGRTRKM